jgi:hypothetical protein
MTMGSVSRGRRLAVRTVLAGLAVVATVGMYSPPASAQERAGAAQAAPTDVVVQFTAACPAAGRITQEWHGGHDGIDIGNNFGTPIYSVGPGRVTHSGDDDPGGYGSYINILHDDGSMTQYGHMQRRLVSEGQRVNAGQQIAEMGSRGSSTGPHLHLRTYARNGDARGINPRSYLSARGRSLPCTPGSNPGQEQVTAWTDANVRDCPRLNCRIVSSVAANETYPANCWIVGDVVRSDGYVNDKWVQLPLRAGGVGYVSAIFLKGDETGNVRKKC